MILGILTTIFMVLGFIVYRKDKRDNDVDGSWWAGAFFITLAFFAFTVGLGGLIGNPTVQEKTPVDNVKMWVDPAHDYQTIVTYTTDDGVDRGMVIGSSADEMHPSEDGKSYYVRTERKPVWWLSPVAWPVDDYDIYVGDK